MLQNLICWPLVSKKILFGQKNVLKEVMCTAQIQWKGGHGIFKVGSYYFDWLLNKCTEMADFTSYFLWGHPGGKKAGPGSQQGVKLVAMLLHTFGTTGALLYLLPAQENGGGVTKGEELRHVELRNMKQGTVYFCFTFCNHCSLWPFQRFHRSQNRWALFCSQILLLTVQGIIHSKCEWALKWVIWEHILSMFYPQNGARRKHCSKCDQLRQSDGRIR